MRWHSMAVLGALACVTSLSGCLFVAGAAIASGVLVVTADDTEQATIDKPFDVVYDASVAELKRRGVIKLQTKEFGRLEADVVSPSDSHVVVKIERQGEKASKLTVSARKLAKTLPDRDTADAIGKSIIEAVSKK